MDQIKFKTGEFRAFTATRSFALGNHVRIENGSELEFDGSTVKYAGADYPFPQLRGALSAGWIVPTESYDSENLEYGKPIAAKIQVRSATQKDQARSMIATIEPDEHIVMNSRTHASNTKAGNRRTASEAGSDGIPVRTLKTPAISSSDVTEAREVLSALDKVKITPGQGITVDEMLERMSDEEREEYRSKIEASKAGYIQDVAAKSGAGKKVGKVKGASGSTVSEGVRVTSSSGGGIETWDGGEAPVVAEISQVSTATTVEDGITFATTNIPATPAKPVKKAAKPVPMSPEVRLKIAKTMCPDFPDSYDFAAPAKKKLARLQADFEDRIDILRAVFAAEDDELKARLVQEFPQAFA